MSSVRQVLGQPGRSTGAVQDDHHLVPTVPTYRHPQGDGAGGASQAGRVMQYYIALNTPRHIAVMHGCEGCGAVVYDKKTHDRWHEKMEGKSKQ